MATVPHVVIRVKRKREACPPDDLVVERREPKRRSISTALTQMQVDDTKDEFCKERFQRLTSTTLIALQQQLSPDCLAALFPTLRFHTLAGRDDADGEPDISMEFTDTDVLMADKEKFTVLDIALDQSVRELRPSLVALSSLPDAPLQEAGTTRESSADDEDDTNFVYDVYFKAVTPDNDTDDSAWQVGAPVIQLMDDQGSVWAESVSDSSADSEDSNAEGYYANSYPDEDTEDSSKPNSSDSEEEGWNRGGGSDEEY